MKKFLILIVVLLSVVTIKAQIVTSYITDPATAVSVTSPTATASIYKISDTVAGYWLIKAPLDRGTKQDFVIKLDSISGNHTNVAVAVYGQKSTLKADWTQIGGTVNWKGTTSDTIIVISNATFNYYQNYKVVYTGTGSPAVTKITQQNLKLWKE